MEERIQKQRWLDIGEQEAIKNVPILFAGAGIGSVIAECALRFGFENITIVDGSKVEESHLNGQNYTSSNIGKYKAESLAKYLKKINPQADIKYHNVSINHDNIRNLIKGHRIAINTLDFVDDIPFLFDDICKEYGVHVLHPYNFGWAGFLTIVNPNGYQLSELAQNPTDFELKLAEYVARYGEFWRLPSDWMNPIVEQYGKKDMETSKLQLSIASWIVSGYCVNAMYNLVVGKPVQYFPKFYLSSFLLGTH